MSRKREKRGLRNLPRPASKRICSLLLSVGDQCVVVRTPGGVRVFGAKAMEKLSLKAKREKPWLKKNSVVEIEDQSQVAAQGHGPGE